MAAGKINLQKASGGVASITIADGVTNTEVTLPESGTVVSVGTTVTDNAIARYDGITGKLQNSGVTIDDNGNLLITLGTGGLGYGTGSGGTVTQLTSITTSVTLNKPSGQVVMSSGSLAAGTTAEFVINNSLFNYLTDTVVITPQAYGYNYRIEALAYSLNQIKVRVTNITASSLSEPRSLLFSIIKGAIS